MLINDSFPVKEKMKYDDMIFNQFDEDVDTDADGSELFSLINQSLEHFNQSVHSSGFDKDGRDSAYETIASSLSNDFFLDQQNFSQQHQFGNGYLLNSKRSLLNNTSFGKNRMIRLPNESSSYNEKIMKSAHGINNLSNNSRVRLESSSSACDPLISCFINNNGNSPPHYSNGSPDFFQADHFEQIRNIDHNHQPNPQVNTSSININKNFDQTDGYSRSLTTAFSKNSLGQTSDMFSKISLVDLKQRKPSGSQALQLRSNSNFQLHSPNLFNTTNNPSYFYDVSPNTRIQSPPLSLYKSQGSTINGSNKKSPLGPLFSYSNSNNKMANSQPQLQKYQPALSSCNNNQHQQQGSMNGINLNRLSKSNRACSFFLRGHCKKRDCEFAHDLRQVTCRFWEYGSCLKGSSCLFLHGYPEGLANNKSIL